MADTFAPPIREEEKTPLYQRLLTDIWIGIVLTMLFLSCICCVCSCLIYHKFQQWKCSVLGNNEEPEMIPDLDLTCELDCESPPNYTTASGLPSYEEALRRMVIGK